MQSGYGGGGGVSEIQQFMVETIGGGASLFPIAAGPAPPTSAALADLHSHHHQYLSHHRPYHLHHPQHSHPVPPPPQFQHMHSHTPITQQLFHPQFQLYHHQHHQQQEEEQRRRRQQQLQQLGLDCQDSGPENSSSPSAPMIGGGGSGGAPPSFLAAAMNFKLAVNESSGGADDDSILHGGDADVEEESSIKEPFWRPLDLDFINNGSKRSDEKEKSPERPHNFKRMKEGGENDQSNNGGTNYKLFSELEAIYKPGGSGSGCGGGASGSALTGETPTANEPLPLAAAGSDQHHVTSDTSTGALEAAAAAAENKKFRRKKRRRRHNLRSSAVFFEGLVKQLMDHQENLHKKFLEAMEKRDDERSAGEEAWRQQQAANASRSAAARALDRSAAAARDAAIISLLQKLTGETLVLPPNPEDKTTSRIVEDNTAIDSGSAGPAVAAMNSSRWPKAEVQALIRVRSGLEVRFQEPGLKGPLWEEVSSAMAAMGYKRSSKRCKEKWENINKYFRKTKDNGKRRPRNSKTCPYFHELDQLYAGKTSGRPAAAVGARKDNSELLDAIVESGELPSTTTGTNTTRFSNGEGENDDDDNETDDQDERLRRKKKMHREVGGGDSDNSSIFERHAS